MLEAAVVEDVAHRAGLAPAVKVVVDRMLAAASNGPVKVSPVFRGQVDRGNNRGVRVGFVVRRAENVDDLNPNHRLLLYSNHSQRPISPPFNRDRERNPASAARDGRAANAVQVAARVEVPADLQAVDSSRNRFTSLLR